MKKSDLINEINKLRTLLESYKYYYDLLKCNNCKYYYKEGYVCWNCHTDNSKKDENI